jgi:hypothetical protein
MWALVRPPLRNPGQVAEVLDGAGLLHHLADTVAGRVEHPVDHEAVPFALNDVQVLVWGRGETLEKIPVHPLTQGVPLGFDVGHRSSNPA